MAERRMFAKTIVLSDAFLDLPMSARCLYFTLGMFADDDGFVNAPRAIMRQCGSSDDDMKLLIAKKFVIIFDSGVIVIKHWRINNYLQKDRIQPTKYIDEKAMLSIDEKGGYTKNAMYTDTVYTQDSIDKDRLDKDSIEENNNTSFSLSDGEKSERISQLKASLRVCKKNNFNPESIYAIAEAEGITREELDG